MFILPALVGFLVFMVWPTLRGHLPELHQVQPADPAGVQRTGQLHPHGPGPGVLERAEGDHLLRRLNIALQTVVALVIAVMMQRLTRSTWARRSC
jgi:multiple sugar transport system permease protein